MRYELTLRINPAELDLINGFLYKEPKTADECLGEDEPISHSVRFPDGYEMDIKCCGVQFEPQNGTNTAWTEAVLFNKDGYEVGNSDVCGDYTGEWLLQGDNGNEYVVKVERGEKDQPTDVAGDPWYDYLDYLKNWADQHADHKFSGMSPVCYDEYLDNEKGVM